MCLLDRMKRNTVEPRFDEVAGDRLNLFVKYRVRYIENLDITNLRGNSLRGRRTNGREGEVECEREARSLEQHDRASRSHSTSPLPPLCTPATQARGETTKMFFISRS